MPMPDGPSGWHEFNSLEVTYLAIIPKQVKEVKPLVFTAHQEYSPDTLLWREILAGSRILGLNPAF